MVRKRTPKPKKISCEICNLTCKSVLHYHHIIPRTEPDCTDDWINVCVICSNCHNRVHSDEIKIIGIFPSTKIPYRRTLVFEENGSSNAPGIKEALYKPKLDSMRIYEKDQKDQENNTQ